MRPSPLFIFAGGGTGGHLTPGLAIFERLREMEPSSRALFLCSDRPLDAKLLAKAGVDFEPMPARSPAIRPFPTAPLRFVRGWRTSRRLATRRLHAAIEGGAPIVVVAMGGFVAAPVAAAGRAAAVPVALVNLDAAPGRANRWIADRADAVWSAVATTSGTPFNEVVGMPIRRSALAPAERDACRSRLGLDPDRSTLLITGASQGADSLNKFIVEFARERRQALDGWQILHLTGPGRDEAVRCGYAGAGVEAQIIPFLDEMGLAWGAADLAISRAGASSVAEAAANAVPTIFAPYPWHKDEHQRLNAEPLVETGGAWLVRDAVDEPGNLESIGPLLERLLSDRNEIAQARAALERRPPIDGAAGVASRLLRMAGVPGFE
ncbi:MAG: glycosyltransferase [Phycisphaerales bacterium]